MSKDDAQEPSAWSLMLTAIRLSLTPASSRTKQRFLSETEERKRFLREAEYYGEQPSAWQRTKNKLGENDDLPFPFIFSAGFAIAFIIALLAIIGHAAGGRKSDLGMTWAGAAASDLWCMASGCPPATMSAVNQREVKALLVDKPQFGIEAGDAATYAIRTAFQSNLDIVATAKTDRLALIALLDKWHQSVIEERKLNARASSNEALIVFFGTLAKGNNVQDAAKAALAQSENPALTAGDIKFDRQIAKAKEQLIEAGLHDFSVSKTSRRLSAGIFSAWTEPTPGSLEDITRQYIDQETGLSTFACFFVFTILGSMATISAWVFFGHWRDCVVENKSALTMAKEAWSISAHTKRGKKTMSQRL